MSNQNIGAYKDKDPIPAIRINQMDNRIVSIERNIQTINNLLKDQVKFIQYEELYNNLKRLEKLALLMEGDTIAMQDSIKELDGKIIENSTKIEMTPELIRLSAEKTEKDTLSKAFARSASYFEVMAESITSGVLTEEFNELGQQIRSLRSLIVQTSESISQTVSRDEYQRTNGVLNGRMGYFNTLIEQTATDITLMAESIVELEEGVAENKAEIIINAEAISQRVTYTVFNELGERVEQNESAITQNADAIDLRVLKTGVIAAINVSEEGVKIVGSKVDITGQVTFSSFDSATNAQLSQAILDSSNAISDLNDIAADNKLTPSEKQELKIIWDSIVGERAGIVNQASTYDVSSTSYTNSYNTLSNYITPLLSNLNTTSDVIGSTLRSYFTTYYNNKSSILTSITYSTKNLTDQAQSTADSKNKVFRTTPSVPYRLGDLWDRGTLGLYVSTVTRLTGSYVASDWATSVADRTMTIIDGGTITSGWIELGNVTGGNAGINGSGNSAGEVRIWAGSTRGNRGSAPFRVTQSGDITATSGRIGDFKIINGSLINDFATGIRMKNPSSDVYLTSSVYEVGYRPAAGTFVQKESIHDVSWGRSVSVGVYGNASGGANGWSFPFMAEPNGGMSMWAAEACHQDARLFGNTSTLQCDGNTRYVCPTNPGGGQTVYLPFNPVRGRLISIRHHKGATSPTYIDTSTPGMRIYLPGETGSQTSNVQLTTPGTLTLYYNDGDNMWYPL